MMSSYDSIYKKMASSLDHSAAGHLNGRLHGEKFDPARHVSPIIAHELNNILTIVQGYADRLLIRHADEPGLQPHLKLISEAAKRAAAVVRDATPANANSLFHQPQNSQPLQPA